MQREKPLLLIVDDEPEVRDSILISLKRVKAEFMEKDNGKQGLEAALEYQPEAILTDINMPVMNGLEMMRELRQQGYEFPIIILSAFDDRVNTVEALRLGAHDFISKPFDHRELTNVVNSALHYGSQLKNFELAWNDYLKDTEVHGSLLDRKKEIFKMKFMRSKKAS